MNFEGIMLNGKKQSTHKRSASGRFHLYNVSRIVKLWRECEVSGYMGLGRGQASFCSMGREDDNSLKTVDSDTQCERQSRSTEDLQFI